EHVREHEVVDVALVARQVDDGALARGLADALEPLLVDDDAVADAVPEPGEERGEHPEDEGRLPRGELVDDLGGLALDLGDGAARGPGLGLDVLAHARAAEELLLDAAGGLLGGPDDDRALALDTAEQGEGHAIGDLGVALLLVFADE